MISIEAQMEEERAVDAVSSELRAVCRKLPPGLLGRAIARAIMQAEAEGPLPEAVVTLGTAPPADADFLRVPVVPQDGTPEPMRHWDINGHRTAEPANGQRLVPVSRRKPEAANGAGIVVGDQALPIAVPPEQATLRRVLFFISESPGANLSDIRKEVFGKLEHISEALRTALQAGYLDDKGNKTRRAYHITEAGQAFLREASEIPMPPKHGHKSDTLLALLREKGSLKADDAAVPIYGSGDRWAVSRARNLLHQLVYNGSAMKTGRGVFAPAQAAA